jgi:hypothetical protein
LVHLATSGHAPPSPRLEPASSVRPRAAGKSRMPAGDGAGSRLTSWIASGGGIAYPHLWPDHRLPGPACHPPSPPPPPTSTP